MSEILISGNCEQLTETVEMITFIDNDRKVFSASSQDGMVRESLHFSCEAFCYARDNKLFEFPLPLNAFFKLDAITKIMFKGETSKPYLDRIKDYFASLGMHNHFEDDLLLGRVSPSFYKSVADKTFLYDRALSKFFNDDLEAILFSKEIFLDESNEQVLEGIRKFVFTYKKSDFESFDIKPLLSDFIKKHGDLSIASNIQNGVFNKSIRLTVDLSSSIRKYVYVKIIEKKGL